MVIMRLRFLTVLVAALLAGWGDTAFAQSPYVPIILDIASKTFSDEQFLSGKAGQGEDVTLSGSLRLPNADPALPLVILLHGTDGPQSVALSSWRDFLTAQGYATLRVDSYSARGLTSISQEQGTLSQFIQIYDAYRAVEIIATDPRIDPSRIVLMGFSRGGTAALFAAMRRFHEAYGPAVGAIAAYVPFYPTCNFQLVSGLDMVDAPIRHFHGAADNWASAAVCRTYADALRAAGTDIVMTEYAGAMHAFDSPLARAGFSNPKAQASFACMRREVDGVLINPETGAKFTYADACVTYGPIAQYDAPSARAAEAAVAQFLNGLQRQPQ
jgi:dienelactone hydrolase